jgi:hypothetical protein
MKEVKKLPEWKLIYDKYKDLDYDAKISYDQINRCLIDGDIRGKKRFVFEQFKKQMLHEENKALENIQNYGYRVVNSNEHARLTNREMKRAERRARVACDIILHTDMERLTDKEKLIAVETARRVQPVLATLISEQKSIQETQKFKLPHIPRV